MSNQKKLLSNSPRTFSVTNFDELKMAKVYTFFLPEYDKLRWIFLKIRSILPVKLTVGKIKPIH